MMNLLIDFSRLFADHCLHTIDLPYRFSSWALDDDANIALWYDEGERLQAWAVLQTPFWAIDIACRSQAEKDMFPQILDWAVHRAGAIKDTRFGHPVWFVNVFSDQAERIRCLEQAGFTCQSDMGEDSWSKVWMQLISVSLRGACSATKQSDPVSRRFLRPTRVDKIPPGFNLRPLAGESEVAAYVDLQRLVFGTENMTVDWRSRTLRQPQYLPDLDLVIEAPDGRLAAFCIAWLDLQRTPPAGQIEPLGVHPDYQRLGLGSAILSEALCRLQQHGAQDIFVETDKQRNPALTLYQSVGFRVIKDVLVYRIEV